MSMTTNKVLVRQYLRRHPATPTKAVNGAIRTLHRLKADKDLKHICHVELSDDPSQVMPNGAGFRRGNCSVVNVEPRDSEDEVGAAFTLRHEAIHARVIAEKGKEAVEGGRGRQHEIAAHEETVRFGQAWLAREKDASTRKRIEEELADEKASIAHLKAQGDEV